MRSSACCRTPVSSLRAATITDRRVEGNLPSVPPFQSDITRIICPTNLRALRPLWRECVPPAHFSLFLRHLVAKKIHVERRTGTAFRPQSVTFTLILGVTLSIQRHPAFLARSAPN